MRLLAFLAVSILPLTALGDTADEVRTRLMERYPATPVDDVRTTPIAGLFEVAMGRKIVYVDATGQYFLFGRIFDLPGNRDLTEDRLRDISRLDVSLIQPDQVLEQGEGSLVLYVFSDPACAHCKKLEQTLAGMPTLRVRTILLPLQPGSSDLARDIWCAPDRQRAWSAWMRNGTRPDRAPEDCHAEVLARNLALAKSFGIRATPALVSPNGRVSLGAMEAPALSAWLNPDQTTAVTVATEVSQ
ncbi:MAG TPA: DsbC family protein [Thiobacillaceae bacterium]|jgi:thiol:disulfide interchange protein DsbC|nr:DsbC family protein [Thiobacillaceae bacterium]HNU63612.1 DsbC family protein [Thiobacillaceae bacterium]